jgi:hypothetical protein
MTGEDDRRLAGFLDDLEQQAASAWAADRELEVAERAQAEYARVTLAARLMAAVGESIDLVVQGIGPIAGHLVRVADGWCLLASGSAEWVIRVPTIQTVRGAPSSAIAPEAWSVTSRLGLASALRGLAGEECVVRLLDGTSVAGRVGRAGADFVELRTDASATALVAYAALAAVRR